MYAILFVAMVYRDSLGNVHVLHEPRFQQGKVALLCKCPVPFSMCKANSFVPDGIALIGHVHMGTPRGSGGQRKVVKN